MKLFNLFLIVFFSFNVANAGGIGDHDHTLIGLRNQSTASQEPSGDPVTWVGVISDEEFSHNEHRHNLRFTRKSDGKSFDLESKSLMTLHHDKEKNFLVEVTGIKTPGFLFWGNNLIVKDFKVLGELESVPHQNVVRPIRESPLSGRI